MFSITEEERLLARQFNTRAKQIFWTNIVKETNPIWHMLEDEVVDWVCRYQFERGLKVDGRLGPSSLIVMMSEDFGGLGGLIIDGKEHDVSGLLVARMFVPNEHVHRVEPDLCCVLSQVELDRECRERLKGNNRVRAHFSIDSSIGKNHESLIIQWADPMRAVPFTPLQETLDYPRQRQCVGIEAETVLLLFQLDSDERRWLRRRPVAKANIAGLSVSQPILYAEQLRAMEHLIAAISEHCQIPHQFPTDEKGYRTDLLSVEELNEFSGFLGKFHYYPQNNEPGVGFVLGLERFFGKLDIADEEGQAKAEIIMQADDYISKMASAREALAQETVKVESFAPTHETDPRFNLSNAIASAYGVGRSGRAARMAQRVQKIDTFKEKD